MEQLHHFFQYGPVTAVVAYVMACVGAGLGLRCVVRAFETTGLAKHSWLVTGAVAIGSGIWTMHLIAILGFAVDGSPVRFDVLYTLLSLLAAIVVVLLAVFALGYSKSRVRGAVLGGIATGAAVVATHYIGMAAMEIHGTLSYEPTTLGLSAVIGVGVSVIAFAVAFLVQGFRGSVVGALLMGLAATGTEYTRICS